MRHVLLIVPLCLGGAASAHAYVDMALPDRDGGGVLTCRECHTHTPEETAAARLSVDGIPERYKPGQVYELTVKLSHPSLMRGGFEASTRTEKGLQAGNLEATDQRLFIILDPASGAQYAHHTKKGTKVDHSQAEISWSFQWTAPDKTAGKVVVRAAGVAANGDGMPQGDASIFFSKTVAPD